MIVELRPAELDRHGLAETLRKHVRLLDRLHPASFTFEESSVCALEPTTEVAVLRVAQEALHNASRHSAAGTVSVRLGCEGGRVVLEIRDDGAGFDVEAATGRGLGIASMGDRAQALGGAVRVRSEPGHGTLVRMEVPA
ncbi:sensor histidine kinase [Streptosporangium lutulentum]